MYEILTARRTKKRTAQRIAASGSNRYPFSIVRPPALFLLLSVILLGGCDGDPESNPPDRPEETPSTTSAAAPPEDPAPEPPAPLPDLTFIAIIDSGINSSHPLFAKAFAASDLLRPHLPDQLQPPPGAPFLGYDFVGGDTIPEDHTGHGSHVAGIIVQHAFKEATSNRLLVLRTGDKRHSLARLTQAVRCLTELRNAGLRIPVALLPLEYYPERHEAAELALFEMAVRDLTNAGTLCVCAAGNKSQDNDDPSGTRHCYPSDFPFPNILSVACANNAGHLHPDSNHGAISVDLAAPGFGIESANLKGKTSKRTGSSQASAFVAARALALAADHATPASLKAALLKQTRIHPSLVGKTTTNGYLPSAP